MRIDVKKELEHSRAAHNFAVFSLPDPNALEHRPIQVNGFSFEKQSQIRSLPIEFGWALFLPLRSVSRVLIKEHNVPLNRKTTLEDWLTEHGIDAPDRPKTRPDQTRPDQTRPDQKNIFGSETGCTIEMVKR